MYIPVWNIVRTKNMSGKTYGDILDFASDIGTISLHTSEALRTLAKTAPEPLNHHLITIAAAHELCADKADFIKGELK